MKNNIKIILLLFLLLSPAHFSANDATKESASTKTEQCVANFVENFDENTRSIALKSLGLMCAYFGLCEIRGASLSLLFEFNQDYLKDYSHFGKACIIGSNLIIQLPLGLYLLNKGYNLIVKEQKSENTTKKADLWKKKSY